MLNKKFLNIVRILTSDLEQLDQARQLVSLYAPFNTLSITKGLYSREKGPEAK